MRGRACELLIIIEASRRIIEDEQDERMRTIKLNKRMKSVIIMMMKK